MAVDVIPLGRPDLGMTRAEMIDVSWMSMDTAMEMYGIFFTLLFGYVVAMYLAGSRLTRSQYVIANTLFLLTMVSVILGTHEAYAIFLYWQKAAWEGPLGLWALGRMWFATATNVIAVVLAIWFGTRVRHQ